MEDKVLISIVPKTPKILPQQQVYMYIPIVTQDSYGMAKFNENFIVDQDGIVSLDTEQIKDQVNLAGYQPKIDNALETESKEIVGAINEVNLKVGQGGGSSLDVQINGTSIVENGVANIPFDNKLDKPTATTLSVVLIDKDGKTASRGISNVPTSGTVATYGNPSTTGGTDGGGCLSTTTPKNSYHCANKKYVDDRFNGAQNAVVFADYASMIQTLNNANAGAYHTGQNVYIRTLNVPDLWISTVAIWELPYTYVSDEDFINELKENGTVTIGHYEVSALETQKVDLTEYKTKDVQINRTSIVNDTGIANIPIWEVGGVMYSVGNGFGLALATSTEIANRSPSRKPVTMENMDLAFRECLVNNKGTLTAQQKANAQKWLGVERLHTYALDGWLNGVCTVFITTKGKANVFLKSMWNTDQWSNPLPYISSDKEVVNMRIRLLDVNAFGAIAEIHCVPFISTLTTASIDENGDISIDDIRFDTGITQFARIHSVYGGDSTPDASDLQWVVNDFTMIFESYIYDYDTGDFKEIDKPVPFIEV